RPESPSQGRRTTRPPLPGTPPTAPQPTAPRPTTPRRQREWNRRRSPRSSRTRGCTATMSSQRYAATGLGTHRGRPAVPTSGVRAPGDEIAIALGEDGSVDNGPRAVLSVLADSIDPGRTDLLDTSGLSYLNRIAPHDLTAVLQASVDADDSLAGLISHFPVGGLTGTLTERFVEERNATGVVHAKTGTLSTVTSLAGGVLDAEGRYLVFSIQIDDVDKDKILEARKTVDDIVTALANCGCR